MATEYAVVKIKSMDPEMFVVIGVDWGAGQIKSMTKQMSEKDMRKHLKEALILENGINIGIENARKNPL